MLLLPQEKG